MGWYFGYPTKKGLQEELLEGRERVVEDSEFSRSCLIRSQCLRFCYRGNRFSGVLWSVWENTWTDLETKDELRPPERWIQCDVMKYIGGDWGYKPMCEGMGPYVYSCPLGYLALVPKPDGEYGANWREGVKAYHARAAQKRERNRQRKLAFRH